MISVDNLVYEYPTKRALHGVSFHLEAATVTALVGPNGAGKTTLLRCLAALEHPFAGRVAIAGMTTVEMPRDVHRRLGYLSDFFGLYDDLSVQRCLTFAAMSHGIIDNLPTVVNRAAERLGLLDRLAENASSLSRGLRQRLAIAQAIIHEPSVLLLDEPASGLDPEARISLSRLLAELRTQGAHPGCVFAYSRRARSLFHSHADDPGRANYRSSDSVELPTRRPADGVAATGARPASGGDPHRRSRHLVA